MKIKDAFVQKEDSSLHEFLFFPHRGIQHFYFFHWKLKSSLLWKIESLFFFPFLDLEISYIKQRNSELQRKSENLLHCHEILSLDKCTLKDDAFTRQKQDGGNFTVVEDNCMLVPIIPLVRWGEVRCGEIKSVQSQRWPLIHSSQFSPYRVLNMMIGDILTIKGIFHYTPEIYSEENIASVFFWFW